MVAASRGFVRPTTPPPLLSIIIKPANCDILLIKFARTIFNRSFSSLVDEVTKRQWNWQTGRDLLWPAHTHTCPRHLNNTCIQQTDTWTTPSRLPVARHAQLKTQWTTFGHTNRYKRISFFTECCSFDTKVPRKLPFTRLPASFSTNHAEEAWIR